MISNQAFYDRTIEHLVSQGKLVDSIAINDQLPLVASRQVEIPHQDVTRVAFIPVARLVHTRPLIATIPGVVFAWITPAGVGHRPLLALRSVGLSVKTP